MKASQMLMLSLMILLVCVFLLRAGGVALMGLSRLLIPIIAIGGAYYFLRQSWRKLQSPRQSAPLKRGGGVQLDICPRCGGVLGSTCQC